MPRRATKRRGNKRLLKRACIVQPGGAFIAPTTSPLTAARSLLFRIARSRHFFRAPYINLRVGATATDPDPNRQRGSPSLDESSTHRLRSGLGSRMRTWRQEDFVSVNVVAWNSVPHSSPEAKTGAPHTRVQKALDPDKAAGSSISCPVAMMALR